MSEQTKKKRTHWNIGPFQVLLWPRMTLCFVRPRFRQRDWALARIYRWVVYIWPVEVRMFR